MKKKIETIIIGGGQGGLATSYYLTQQRRDHVILEAADRPAYAWRNDRWDSFTFITPNWSFRLPGAEYDGPDPDGYMLKDEIVARFERYVSQYHLPIMFGVRALVVEPNSSLYHVKTDQGEWEAANVVIATGLYQKARIPVWWSDISADILQLSSGQYRNPDMLPPGAVLVTGSGQSGCQIAEELYQSGRKVYLCVGSAGRTPRRYRGRDLIAWFRDSGFFNRTPENLASPQARFASNPLITGKDGGHTLNLHQFYRDGVVLLGRLKGFKEGVINLANDLKENLVKGDDFEIEVTKRIDRFIERAGIDAPRETLPIFKDGYSAPDILTLDLEAAGITSIIWAQGYTFDFSMVKAPISDEAGFPKTNGGITSYPGLYFSGLPWLPDQKSGILLGVAETASRVAEHIIERRRVYTGSLQ